MFKDGYFQNTRFTPGKERNILIDTEDLPLYHPCKSSKLLKWSGFWPTRTSVFYPVNFYYREWERVRNGERVRVVMLLTCDYDRFQSFDEERLSDREHQARSALRFQSPQWMIASRAARVTVGRYHMSTANGRLIEATNLRLYAARSTSARLGIAEIAGLKNDGNCLCDIHSHKQRNHLALCKLKLTYEWCLQPYAVIKRVLKGSKHRGDANERNSE